MTQDSHSFLHPARDHFVQAVAGVVIGIRLDRHLVVNGDYIKVEILDDFPAADTLSCPLRHAGVMNCAFDPQWDETLYIAPRTGGISLPHGNGILTPA